MIKAESIRHPLLMLGFIGPALMVIGISLVAHQMASESTLAYAWVKHTYQVLSEIDREMRLVLEAETGVRGYVMTGEKHYLAPTPVPAEAGALLAELTKENRRVQPEVTRFRDALAARYAHLNGTIELRRDAGFEQALARVKTGEGRQLGERVREAGDRLGGELLSLLKTRQERTERYARLVRILCFVFLVSGLAVVGLAGFLMVRVRRLQNLVKVCAWTQRIQHRGRWIRFEEYLFERFGVRTTHGMSADAADQVRTELERLQKPKTTL